MLPLDKGKNNSYINTEHMVSIKPPILCLEVPQFAASVEQALEPRWRHRPLAVAWGERLNDPILSLSPQAVQWGLRPGMRVGEAQRLCRDIIITTPHPSVYRRAIRAIEERIAQFTPLYELNRKGRWFLDLSGTSRLWGEPVSVGERLQRALGDDFHLPSEVGLASNKLVSKVAAGDAQPWGLVAVSSGEEEPFMAPHRVEVLPVVKGAVKRTLYDLNISYLEEVVSIPIEFWVETFGRWGAILYHQARGFDSSPVHPPQRTPSLPLACPFNPPTNERGQIEPALHQLILEGYLRLEERSLLSGEVSAWITYADGREKTVGIKQVLFTDPDQIGNLTSRLLNAARERRVQIEKIEVTFWSLFPGIKPGHLEIEKQRKREELLKAIGEIRHRMGSHSVRWGIYPAIH